MASIVPFINSLADELAHFPPTVAEEKIVLEVTRKYGPPNEGNTDLIRHFIRKAQGRDNTWQKLSEPPKTVPPAASPTAVTA